MTAFDGREKDFEARFKHDQELQFKVTARRNRLLGLWAAERMGLGGDAAPSSRSCRSSRPDHTGRSPLTVTRLPERVCGQ
jgi:hypothetical protein